jgi:site-specific recombinase XerD
MEATKDFQTYLEARGSSERTIRAYIADVTMALESVRVFDAPDLENYLSVLAGRGTARATVSRKLAALRAYGDFLEFSGQLERNPALRVSIPHRSPRVAQESYVRNRNQALGEIVQTTQLRVTEIVMLNAEDVSWRDNALTLLSGVRVKLGEASRVLRSYLSGRSRGPLFLSETGDRLSSQRAHDALERQDVLSTIH